MNSKNPTIDTILSHKSIRRFKADQISNELLRQIVQCGSQGSTSGNLQSWTVIATSDPVIKKALYETHYEQEMVLSAPVILTFCADLYRTTRWLEISEANKSFDDLLGFMKGTIDAIIAAQNIVLAAESNGLGICYLGTTLCSPERISEILALPNLVVPVTSVVLGYPDEVPMPRSRLPIDSLLHFERYQDYSDEQLKETFKDKEINGWQRYRSDPETSAAMDAAGIKNLGQYYTSSLKYGKAQHQKDSKNLLELIRSKGFWNF